MPILSLYFYDDSMQLMMNVYINILVLVNI